MTTAKTKICVIGTGHLGNYHTKLLSEITEADLVGIYDIDRERASAIALKYNTEAYDSMDELLKKCDAAVISSPTATHRAISERAIELGCHVLVEKPIANNTSEGREMVAAAKAANRIMMVGHVEHFNPAFSVARDYLKNPRFIESHRLTIYRGRGADVSVIHDLLIHDLELILAVLEEPVVSMEASASRILTESPDIANVRLKFEGGCVANLTASRISLTNMRKMRFFVPGAYIGLDFGGNVELATLSGTELQPPEGAESFELPNNETIYRWQLPVPEANALQSELLHFIECVQAGKEPLVSGRRGLEALQLADNILKSVD